MATHDDLMAVARAVIKECWACWGSYRPSEDEGDARRKDDVDPTAIVAPFAREAGERERVVEICAVNHDPVSSRSAPST